MNLEDAIAHWNASDPTLAAVAKTVTVSLREEDLEDPFAALVQSICHQQISLAAGRAVFGRVRDAAGPDPSRLLALGEDGLRAQGLSRPKARYVLDLSQQVLDGTLDLPSLAHRTDDEVIEALTRVKGIGVWSAKMHLIFHMQRPDVCPFEDLGVQLAACDVYGVSREEVRGFLQAKQADWSPFNSLAARVLWQSRAP